MQNSAHDSIRLGICVLLDNNVYKSIHTRLFKPYIHKKKIATNSLNTPHQPRQITITQKLLYSSSPKWSSYCSLASLILPFKYSFFLSPSFCLAHSLPQLHAKRFGPQTVPISPTKERPIDLSPLRSI